MPTDNIKEVIMEALKMALEGEWEAANKLIVMDTVRIEDRVSHLEKTANILSKFIEEDIEIDS